MSNQAVTVGKLFLILIILIIIGAVGVGYWQLYRLRELSISLHKQQATEQNALFSMQQSLSDLQRTTDSALSVVNEWKAVQKGNLNKWYVAEAQYLVKLANDHLEFTHNTTMALILLQRADQVLHNLQDSSVLDIHKSLAEKIADLQQQPKVDVTGLYLALVALNKQLDQLQLPASPLKASQQPIVPVAESTNATWWQRALDQSWQALQKIVIVRNNTKNVLPLVMPEEKIFLYQNLHAQLEEAMWGALHRNMDVYKTSLARAIEWTTLYFDQEAPTTQSMLQNLNKLQEVNIQPPVVSLAPTLQLFDSYFASTGTRLRII